MRTFVTQSALLVGLAVALHGQAERKQAAEHVKRARAMAAQQKHEQAIAEFERALSIHRASKDRFQEVILLSNMASSWNELGEPDKAIPLFEEALRIQHETKDATGVAYTLLGLANAHWFGGEPQQAFDAYRRLVSQTRAIGNEPLLAHALNNGGLVLQSLGQDREALEQHQQALSLFQKTAQRGFEGYALNNAGMAHANLGDARSARSHYERALAIFRELRDAPSEAYALHNMGDLALRAGDHEQAIQFYRQSLERKRAARDRYGEAWSLARLAEANHAKGEIDGARLLANQALSIHRAIGDQAGEANALASLGRLERAAGNGKLARERFEAAIDIVEKTRGSIATPELRGSYFATRQSIFEQLTDMLVEAGDASAIVAMERSRARLLLDSARGDASYERVQRQIFALGQRLRKTLSAADTETIRERLRILIAQAGSMKTPGRGTAATAAELKRAAGDGTIVEYWLGERRSAVFTITRATIVIAPLPPRGEIERRVTALIAALTARGASTPRETAAQRAKRIAAEDAKWRGEAAAFAKLIWPGTIAAGPVLVVPHGALAHVPFSLITSGASVTTAPSASLQRHLGNASRAPRALAVIADPVLGNDWPPLAFAAAEAASITAMLPAGEATVRTRERAARGPELFSELARHRILHFGTHAEVNHSDPGRSMIALTGAPITLEDINNMRIDADLVVLSACRTALGQELRGEGLLGLTHGFLHAGANRVLATLWSVDDQATAAFMREFYSNLLRKRLSPPKALSEAQAAMRKNPRWLHPWYWAGFALHGYWR